MKIRTKLIYYILGCLSIGVIGAIVVVAAISIPYLTNEETKKIYNDVDKASAILTAEFNTLARTQSDWSIWDETYDFIDGRLNSYAADNLGSDTLVQLDLVSMIFSDKNGNIVYNGYLDEASSNVNAMILQRESFDVLTEGISENQINRGLSLIDNKLYLISVEGTTNTERSVPYNGYLILVRALDEDFFDYMAHLLDTDIALQLVAGDGNHNYNGIEPGEIKRDGMQITFTGNADDLLENGVIQFVFQHERVSFAEAIRTLKTVSYALCMMFFFIGIGTVYVVSKREVRRITYLSDFVQTVVTQENLSLRTKLDGKDELAHLGANINRMLIELEKNYQAIQKNDEHLNLIMEATNDGYFDYDLEKDTMTISQGWYTHLGYNEDDNEPFDRERVLNTIIEEDREDFINDFNAYLENQTGIFYKALRAYKATRGFIWVLVRGRAVSADSTGRPTRFVGSFLDITEKKDEEDRNRYLRESDPVTHLYNRAHIEKIIDKINRDETVSDYCIIMLDINGLKLFNDAFGLQEGDRLLKTIGDILKLCCADTDTPARWGGDEFIILVNNDRMYADTLMNATRKEIEQLYMFPIKVSVAFGCANAADEDASVENVITRAEEKMYQTKLLDSRSFRNGIIASLEQQLYNMKIETPDRIKRRMALCRLMGDAMHLSAENSDALMLLNLLQGIGKIRIGGVSAEQALNTNGAAYLETGCRLLKSVPEIAHIANDLMYHEEHYDGTGVPTGVSGETIPLNTRISKIICSFDDLITAAGSVDHESVVQAKENIKRLSGKSFDPRIVEAFLRVIDQWWKLLGKMEL
ncbi:MAG: hypothetical protein PWP51_2744 [Clostridiales bacterium]|nr:hypothetical protein [Clostridiales bacterium]